MGAFLQAYNLDYKDLLKLPYKIFIAYLNCLPDETQLIKIIQLRNTPDNELSHSNKLLEIKRKFSLNQNNQASNEANIRAFVKSLNIVKKGE